MIKRTLGEISSMAGGIPAVPGSANVGIQGVSIDTRTLRAGSLFVPIVRIDDGHNYVRKAFEEGAAASLWQADHGPAPEGYPVIVVENTLSALQRLARSYRERLGCTVIGITGSNGKTTVKDMAASLLSSAFRVHKTQGNFNGEYGLPLTLLSVREDAEIVVLEMGMSQAGEMRALSEIARPDIGVITMIGVSHLSNLGSREGIAAAKLELLAGLNPDGALLINGDEPLLTGPLAGMDLPETLSVIRFGESSANDYYPLTIDPQPSGYSFTLNDSEMLYSVPLLGRHNVLNAIAAIAVADRFRIARQDIQSGLLRLEVTGMRMERILSPNGFLIINDAWNASPVSMKAAIDAVSDLEGFRRKVLVLGDMLELGGQEVEFHEEVGRSIDRTKINAVLTFGTVSRHLSGVLAASQFDGVLQHFTSKEELISACRRLLRPNDVVLVKGSRSLRLEEVCDALTKPWPGADPKP